ncbi:MAG: alpha/beta hydrolase [Bacteroidales bacterium]|nr:alpha/beta hydrolase [Bacteroidales bacterium]
MKKAVYIAVAIAAAAVIIIFTTTKSSHSPASHYSGTVGDIRVFVSLTAPGKKISGEYFYAGEKALAEKESLSLKRSGENRYRLNIRLHGKRLKGSFTGAIGPDTVNGILTLTEKAAEALKVPPESRYPVFLIRETPLTVPPPDHRYERPVFDSVIKSEGIRFATAPGYYTEYAIDKTEKINYAKIITKDIFELLIKEDLDLYLDFYRPWSDTLSKRPVILMLHGGAFLAGDRKTPTILRLSDYLCRLGYTVASADYRLGFNPLVRESMERCSYRAVQDARAALRYLVRYAPDFGIDTSAIFIAGTSAGSITALYTAYLEDHENFPSVAGKGIFYWSDMGCLDCSGNELESKYRIRGVINMWGAMHDTAIMDAREKIPLISFHGTGDNIVPYGYDYPFRNINSLLTRLLMRKLYGSGPLHDHACRSGIPNRLFTFEGYDHEPQISEGGFNHNLDTLFARCRDFLYSNLAPDMTIEGPARLHPNDPLPVYILPFIPGCKFFWEATGGQVLSEGLYKNQTAILWTRTGRNRIKVTAITPAGRRLETEMVVEMGKGRKTLY